MSVLVIVEHNNQEVKNATLSTISAAIQLNAPIVALVLGFQCQKVVNTLCSINGITEVRYVDHGMYQYPVAEKWSDVIIHIAQDFKYILAPATTFGKNIMPRAAAMLAVSQISDIIEVVDANTYKRPIYAGNAIETVCSSDPIQVITIRPTAFKLAGRCDQEASLTKLDYLSSNQQSRFNHIDLHRGERPELSSADIVISGGRGLKDKENFERLMAIADRLGAAVGASRAAVDAGLAPNDFQVGQTGQVVAPKLYIAICISGAIQHLAGMKDSKIIVAINKDSDAPIFQVANYGLVADINDVFQDWEAALTSMGY